jgi:hypothetical protein
MTERAQLIALPTVPATAATSAGIAARLVLHDAAVAWGISGVAGLLALIAVIAVSAETQRTLRTWIQHRAEHRVAAAISFAIRRQARAATCGKRRNNASAKEVRRAASKVDWSTAGLADIMVITRMDRGRVVEPDRDRQEGSADDRDECEGRAALEMIQGSYEQSSARSASA